MKKNIHPTYYNKAKAFCACGNTFALGATKEKIEVEVCSNCHPFFTGKEKLVDTAGRVEKFKARAAAAKPAPDKRTRKKTK
jgi:large subunit ribosomal protein L31